MTIFFDLDGTILDISERYYRIYSHLLSENGYDIVPKEIYWNAKRKRIPEKEILGYTNATKIIKQYLVKRKKLIENIDYLAYDCLQDSFRNVISYLLKKKHNAVLVTLRKSRANLMSQLKQLGIDEFFDDVLCSKLDEFPRWKIKFNLMKKYLKNAPESFNVFVSDTENDIKAGIELGFTTISVCNGIRNSEILEAVNSDYLCKSVSELVNLYIFK